MACNGQGIISPWDPSLFKRAYRPLRQTYFVRKLPHALTPDYLIQSLWKRSDSIPQKRIN